MSSICDKNVNYKEHYKSPKKKKMKSYHSILIKSNILTLSLNMIFLRKKIFFKTKRMFKTKKRRRRNKKCF